MLWPIAISALFATIAFAIDSFLTARILSCGCNSRMENARIACTKAVFLRIFRNAILMGFALCLRESYPTVPNVAAWALIIFSGINIIGFILDTVEAYGITYYWDHAVSVGILQALWSISMIGLSAANIAYVVHVCF